MDLISTFELASNSQIQRIVDYLFVRHLVRHEFYIDAEIIHDEEISTKGASCQLTYGSSKSRDMCQKVGDTMRSEDRGRVEG